MRLRNLRLADPRPGTKARIDISASLVQAARSQGVADRLRRTALRLPEKIAVRGAGTTWSHREFPALSVGWPGVSLTWG
jgi:hypothetical protein